VLEIQPYVPKHWSPSTHRYFPASIRKAVKLMLLWFCRSGYDKGLLTHFILPAAIEVVLLTRQRAAMLAEWQSF
jgi:hypothetical protein